VDDQVRKRQAKPAPRGRPEMSEDARNRMREKIAKAAEDLFRESGYAAVSMRKISASVGCTPMALYSYFPAKIDILQTLWGGVFDAVFSKVNSAPRKSDPADMLVSIATVYVTYWMTYPDHYRLVFMSEGVTQPDVSLFLDRPDSVARFGVFARAISDTHSSPLDPPVLKMKLDLLLCLLHGIAHNTITISGYEWTAPGDLISEGVKCICGS
jgi:AcrR family transcriptional regulator